MTDSIPLPIHWFVFSTGSNVEYFRFENLLKKGDIQEGKGKIHMEKNWG